MATTVPATPDPAASATEAAIECRDRMLATGLPFERVLGAGATASTKNRILDTAITLFAERGFEACTMRDLASEVGIKAPAIYNHYASKDVVLAEAMQQILGQFFGYVLEALEDDAVEDWLETIVRRHILFQLDHPRHAQANDALMNAPGTERNLPRKTYRRIVDAQHNYIHLIRSAVLVRAPEMDRNDALIAAFAIAATADRVASWYDPKGSMPPDEIADRHWDLVQRAVARG